MLQHDDRIFKYFTGKRGRTRCALKQQKQQQGNNNRECMAATSCQPKIKAQQKRRSPQQKKPGRVHACPVLQSGPCIHPFCSIKVKRLTTCSTRFTLSARRAAIDDLFMPHSRPTTYCCTYLLIGPVLQHHDILHIQAANAPEALCRVRRGQIKGWRTEEGGGASRRYRPRARVKKTRIRQKQQNATCVAHIRELTVTPIRSTK